VVLFTYYFCARGPQLRRTVCSMLPPRQQNEVLRAWDLAIDKTAGFLYSRVLLGIASTLAHYVALRVLDVPYALTLALWVGLVSQFIPTVGTYLAGALPMTATGTAFAGAYVKRHELVEHPSLEIDLPGDPDETPPEQEDR
jgi:predicted PurR-regulated permease PerM